MSYLIGFLAFIFILGAAVIIHEFGHFIVAKLLKIRVETFSVGFGPRLFGRKWGTTDYRVSAIPLGGYVKLGGDESNAAIEGESATDIPPAEQFNLRPRWQKFLVAVAGPVMNILTALLIPFVAALSSGVPVSPSLVVKKVVEGGAADVAGIKPGDRIVAFNGTEDPKWDDLRGDVVLSPGQQIPLVVERGGQRVPLTVTPASHREGDNEIGELNVQFDFGNVPVVVRSVDPGTPAAEAGVQVGDRIVALNGEPMGSGQQVVQYIQDHNNQSISMTVERDGQPKELKTSERRLDGWRLGFGTNDIYPIKAVGIAGAATEAVHSNVEILRLTGKALGQAFSGRRSLRDTLSGPIGIAKESSRAANEFGWGGVFIMLGFLSLNLGIFNLLPIPVLDGGAIFILLIEAVLGLVGMTLSMRVRERIQQVGFVVLLLLMGFVITNDLLKLTSSRGRDSEQNKPAATAPQK